MVVGTVMATEIATVSEGDMAAVMMHHRGTTTAIGTMITMTEVMTGITMLGMTDTIEMIIMIVMEAEVEVEETMANTLATEIGAGVPRKITTATEMEEGGELLL